ncbi:MAG: hypothetical protein PHT99_02505 [Methanoregula sp.]|nr:hypothetical protein [Methanoregula sp.]
MMIRHARTFSENFTAAFAGLVVGSSLVLQVSSIALPKEISWLAIAGYTAAVLCGFYAIYHVIFLKFRMER